ncbi:GNAT family N-acetyltransferase [Blautia sp.]|jgi:ribosomal protein S18 acetylase RimI-like enzyme|uniref:GNAT family N-acetyltransferase n=2 Tax=Blautia TaxID=572511 RepID=UPI0029432724|nr:GNAT family N-acetyltransferase [Blautia sp.]MED9881451.1 GNAT family N-acetyltransferase [Blautia sp.]
MTENIKIRNLIYNDYVIVNRGYQTLHSEHVEGRPDIYKEMKDIFLEEEYSKMLTDPDYIMIGAEEDGRLTGFLIAKRKITPVNPMLHRNRTFFVDALFVEQDCRRKGTAKRLYEYLAAKAEEEECARIDLKVWGFNKGALAFYQSMGFQIQSYNMEKKLI